MKESRLFAAAALLLVASAGPTAWAQAMPMSMAAPAATTASPAKKPSGQQGPLFTKAQGTTNRKAEEKYRQGYAAQEQEDYWNAARAYREAIELDPSFVAAHKAFINASKTAKLEEADGRKPGDPPKAQGGFMSKGRAIPMGAGPARAELLEVYQAWLQKYPNVAAVQWGMGEVTLKFQGPEREQAAEYYRKALSLDSKCVPAYSSLAQLAGFAKDQQSEFEYQKKAAEIDPEDGNLQYSYATSLKERNPEAYRAGLAEFAARFPKHKLAMFALVTLASTMEAPADRAATLERVWKQYAHEARNPNYAFAMEELYELLLKLDLNKAVQLSADMVNGPSEVKTFIGWDQLHTFAVQLADSRKLVDQKLYAEAATVLKKTKLPRGTNVTGYYLLRAEAEGAGSPKSAYESLKSAAAKEPNEALNAALMTLAAKLGKSAKQVDDELWEIRVKSAVPFKDFELVNYADGKPVKLSDFRGKTVLVNFWNPG